MGEIRENQLVKLFFKIADGSEKELNCNVKSFEEDRLSLYFPEETIEFLDYLQEGEEISVKLFTPLGVKIFDSIVLNSPQEEDFVVEYNESSESVQRREYTRIDFRTKVIIERENNEVIVSQTLDIGGGGLKFDHQGTFFPDEIVNITLYLPLEFKSIRAKGIVLEKDHLPSGQHVLTFTEILESDRDKIIKQCFDTQQERLRT